MLILGFDERIWLNGTTRADRFCNRFGEAELVGLSVLENNGVRQTLCSPVVAIS